MNTKLRNLLKATIAAIETEGGMSDDTRNAIVVSLERAVAEDGDPGSIVYPIHIKVVGITEVGILLGIPNEVLADTCDSSPYSYGDNDRTLVTADHFCDDILEMCFDGDGDPMVVQEIVTKFRKSVSADTFIDLEA
jgi:hypothetical protein